MAGVAAWLAAAGMANACTVELAGQAPLTKSGVLYETPVSINGQAPLSFLVDTGAMRTKIHAAASSQLGLMGNRRRSHSIGIDGSRGATTEGVTVPSLEFAGLVHVRKDLGVDPVLVDGRPAWMGTWMGTVGADHLSGFDVELDFPAGQLRLHRVKDCNATDQPLRPWTTPYDTVPLKRSSEGMTSIPVVMDGKTLELALDTGSNRTRVSMKAASHKLGLDLEQLKAQSTLVRSSSSTGKQLANYARRIGRIDVGRSSYGGVQVMFSELQVDPYDGLLGLDFLANRRVWLSYATNQLFVTSKK
ncbi:MAG: retropepsin-like domain-containing protein [Proteobacteria bacterium]|nr:retropepsin-like domain-containing protein [Pseudomonadota bacterium]